MGLVSGAGGLLAKFGALLTSCECCKWWCTPDYTQDPDRCGNYPYACGPEKKPESIGPFPPGDCQCPAAPPCCSEDADCPEKFCCAEDGSCIPCEDPPDPPEGNWYCCLPEDEWDSITDPDRFPSCHYGMCEDNQGNPAPGLVMSGPHTTQEACLDQCRSHNCVPSACCDTPVCQPDPDGPYETFKACSEACANPPAGACVITDPDAPSRDPLDFRETGTTQAGAVPYVKEWHINCDPGPSASGKPGGPVVCVHWVTKKGHPIRVQLLSDQLYPGTCEVTGTDIIRLDSQWQGDPECDCVPPRPTPPITLPGVTKGKLIWRTKQRGITSFKIRVFAPCPGTVWEYTVACHDCLDVPDSTGCTIPCECGVDLTGLTATFEGHEFTLGTGRTDFVLFDDYEGIWQYTPIGNAHVFEYTQSLGVPASAPGEFKRATLFCDTDDTVTPPVDRWYVEFVTDCNEYDEVGNQLAFTRKTEIGYFRCYPSDGCDGRDPEDPIPSGSPQFVEEVEWSPETQNGLDACDPPERASLTIFENCQ